MTDAANSDRPTGLTEPDTDPVTTIGEGADWFALARNYEVAHLGSARTLPRPSSVASFHEVLA